MLNDYYYKAESLAESWACSEFFFGYIRKALQVHMQYVFGGLKNVKNALQNTFPSCITCVWNVWKFCMKLEYRTNSMHCYKNINSTIS